MPHQTSEFDARLPLPLLSTVAVVLPLLVAGLLDWFVVIPGDRSARFEIPLVVVTASDADTLESIFSRHDYFWPPEITVPPLLVARIPSDVSRLQAERKKSLFFRIMLPVVLAENERVRRLQQTVRKGFENGAPPPGSEQWQQLTAIAYDYGVNMDVADPLFERRLLKRVDVIPPGLVLAQAANESAWGTSRFAREGNNLFGEWTWNADQGMVPLRRMAGADHYVRVFPDLRSSVRAYLKNLNTASAYRELRGIRAELREAGRPLEPLALAEGLLRYSERGLDYVAEIRAMIDYNRLSDLGRLRLAESPRVD